MEYSMQMNLAIEIFIGNLSWIITQNFKNNSQYNVIFSEIIRFSSIEWAVRNSSIPSSLITLILMTDFSNSIQVPSFEIQLTVQYVSILTINYVIDSAAGNRMFIDRLNI